MCIQCAAGSSSPAVLRQLFSKIPVPVKKAILEKIGIKLGSPGMQQSPESLEQLAFNHVDIFKSVLKMFVRESVEQLPQDQKDVICWRMCESVYQLSPSDQSALQLSQDEKIRERQLCEFFQLQNPRNRHLFMTNVIPRLIDMIEHVFEGSRQDGHSGYKSTPEQRKGD